MANSRAQFTQADPDDAAYTNVGGGQYPVQGSGGKHVPEAVGTVISSGITIHDYKGFYLDDAPALLWSARFDVRWNQSFKGYVTTTNKYFQRRSFGHTEVLAEIRRIRL